MKEKGKVIKSAIKIVLIIFVLTIVFSDNVNAAKLNKTSLTLEKGKTYTLKLKGTKKKATWKTKNKKVASISNKKKSSVKIKAVKAGKTIITAKVGKKTYKCKVTVIKREKKADNTSVSEEDTKKEETTETKTEEKPEQTPAKKKVWIVTKQSKIEYTPVYVNKRSELECTCGFKSEDSEEFGEHTRNHLRKEEACAYRVNTIWDSCYYVSTEYPEEGYWTEINANEYPEGMYWRSEETAKEKKIKDTITGEEYQMTTGYLYINKLSN